MLVPQRDEESAELRSLVCACAFAVALDCAPQKAASSVLIPPWPGNPPKAVPAKLAGYSRFPRKPRLTEVDVTAGARQAPEEVPSLHPAFSLYVDLSARHELVERL